MKSLKDVSAKCPHCGLAQGTSQDHSRCGMTTKATHTEGWTLDKDSAGRTVILSPMGTPLFKAFKDADAGEVLLAAAAPALLAALKELVRHVEGLAPARTPAPDVITQARAALALAEGGGA